LNPVKAFAGSFGGKTLYENPAYITPNAARSAEKRKHQGEYRQKINSRKRRERHASKHKLDPEEFAGIWNAQLDA